MIESRRFQKGSLTVVKNKTAPDTWFLRYYEDAGEKRVYRRKRTGTVLEFPHRRDAEKAVLALRGKINHEACSPETVNGLLAHYQKYELTPARKAFASIENHLTLSKCYIAPRWGSHKLGEVRPFRLKNGLTRCRSLRRPRRRLRVSSLFCTVMRFAMSGSLLTPSAKVLLVGSTGVRRSELMALVWTDVNVRTMEVSMTKSCVRNRFGDTKTECSRRPVPLHPLILESLLDWKRQSLYQGDGDFLFPSIRLNGTKPLSPDSLLKKSIRPALERAGIEGKIIGWHNFRHTLGTLLRAIGTDIKVAQDLLRHANSRTTLDIYSRRFAAKARRQHKGG
jgi:integrase